MKRGQGQWNAYVSTAPTEARAKQRYAKVPAEFKKGVYSHMRTIKQIKEANK